VSTGQRRNRDAQQIDSRALTRGQVPGVRPIRIALGLEYDGSAFCGWQAQGHCPSVQEAVERALARVADHPVRVHAAGRTDAGVHATGQVLHFDTWACRDARAWVLGVNSALPEAVAVTWARRVDMDFHARFRASGRQYCYLLLNRRAPSALWHARAGWECRPLDLAAMQAAAAALQGRHDFSAFRGSGCQARSPEREVRSVRLERHGDLIALHIAADGFLLHMVRNIVGSLLRVGRGEERAGWLGEILASRDRRRAGMTAAPQGLYLTGVDYPAVYGLPAGNPFPFVHGEPLPVEPGIWRETAAAFEAGQVGRLPEEEP
jgi:tRNA pseudouridine38-40 synthase